MCNTLLFMDSAVLTKQTKEQEMNTAKMIALLSEVKEKEKADVGKNATPSIASLRRALSAKYGKRNYKITSSGEVLAFGEMHNAGRDGWHHIGCVSDTLLYVRLDMLSIY